MIEETQNVLPLFDGVVEPQRNAAASSRWMLELGQQIERLAFMLRKPTEARPFVYEVRFDLLPAKANDGLLVLKGFGEEGGLCSFVNGGSFLGLLRQGEELMGAGKLKWYPDQYEPSNYQKRQERYLSGEFYRV